MIYGVNKSSDCLLKSGPEGGGGVLGGYVLGFDQIQFLWMLFQLILTFRTAHVRHHQMQIGKVCLIQVWVADQGEVGGGSYRIQTGLCSSKCERIGRYL